MYSYYPRHGWNFYRPCRYCYKPYYYPYNNFFNSQFAYSDQNLYNSGIMNDVIQQSIISQVSKDKVEENKMWEVKLNDPEVADTPVWEGTGQAITPEA